MSPMETSSLAYSACRAVSESDMDLRSGGRVTSTLSTLVSNTYGDTSGSSSVRMSM